ncbi:MAG: response regulator transcription factor [Clostridiales Family XIII bacterium]|jgi:DNA-binding response OmpR family regulator|nr:response regulator transcription factor [Clostridiales Family XIII bacterium]
MNEKILIVEDDEKLARIVELELGHEGYETEKAFDGVDGLAKATGGDYGLILLDVMLPGMSGIEVLRRLRKTKDVPVILLTARDETVDKVQGLDSGADDYVTKPFEFEELLARIRAAMRHREAKGQGGAEGGGGNETVITVIAAKDAGEAAGGAAAKGAKKKKGEEDPGVEVRLDTAAYTLTVAGAEVELTHKEFELLACLLENRGRVMTREALLNSVWGYDYIGETNVVDVYVRFLRSKIDEPYGVKLVTTVRGVGYKIP